MKLLISALSSLLFVVSGSALEPKELLLIVNSNIKESKILALDYCNLRGVPVQNIVEFPLPETEDISRKDYNDKLAAPLRKKLADFPGVLCLVTFYGVPLRVQAPVLSDEQRAAVIQVRKDLEASTSEEEKNRLRTQERLLSFRESVAAVDSELMLVLWPDYPLQRWQVNPLYWKAPPKKIPAKVFLTGRIDAPTVDVAKRLITDAIEAEKSGLVGKAYIDARGFRFDPKAGKDSGTGYSGYDESYRETAEILKRAKIETILDNKQELFAKDSCPDAIFYSGWYSHASFIPSFQFKPGAIAWHLASSEAVSLKRKDAPYWCPNLLRTGAAVTLGPVGEPYTIGFPKPAEFFSHVLTGQYTLAECFGRTTVLTSWMMTCIGDPLYNPFRGMGLMKVEDIQLSPRGAPLLFEKNK
ncbi:MAG: TIGR03790 family protein [Zavarzinella sp.]